MMVWLALLLLLVPPAVAAHNDEHVLEIIERLEARVEQLEKRLGIQAAPDMSHPEMASASGDGALRESVATDVTHSGVVSTRYWLSKTSPFEGKVQKPLREGLMALASLITLDPKHYGEKSSGLFDPHLDPSRFQVAALSIEGELLIKAGGSYRLVVKPTPPREVGGSGNVEVAVDVFVAGDRLFSMPPSPSLIARHKEITLPAGHLPLRIEIVSRSPGFGPSPTRSKVFIGLQAEEAIAPVPLNQYLVLTKQNEIK